MRQEQALLAQTGPDKSAFENADEKIVFSYTGENQSYHTGLRNKTVFYIDYKTGTVMASEAASFEEPAGTDMIRRGTDTVKFEGTYDVNTNLILGELAIYTQGTATGGSGNCDNTITYTMEVITLVRWWVAFLLFGDKPSLYIFEVRTTRVSSISAISFVLLSGQSQ